LKHEHWVRTELEGWSRSLGFRYTPREEIELRLGKVREGMARRQMEALLVVQKMDYFYLSGTTQDGLLFVPLEGEPLLMVKRELETGNVCGWPSGSSAKALPACRPCPSRACIPSCCT